MRTRQFGNNLRSLFGWRDARRDVREEMALHVELRAAELERRGIPRADARARAEREVGNPGHVEAAVARLAGGADRSSAWAQRAEELAADTRHAVRVFRHSPGFSALAVLTIALGLGANAAMFALVNTVLFRPLPFDRDHTLVRVREYRQGPDGTRNNVDASRRTADAVAERPDLFASSVPMVGTSLAMLRPDGALHVAATRVGPRFTSVLEITPILGRTFTPEEERAGETAGVMLISHRLWVTVFGARTTVIGERVPFDGRSLEIVGVLPAGFHVPYHSEAWIPSRFGEQERSVFILARIAAGVTFEQVVAELEPLGVRLRETYPDVMRGLGVTAVRARDYFVDNEDRVPLALMGAVGFLLLIGCANVALLLTARFASRRREVAVRAALGCGRGRQIRQFVTEALMLFAIGGAIGLLVAAWLRDSLTVFLPEAIATQVGIQGVRFDLPVIAFTTGLSVAAGVAFGLVSAMRSTRADLNAVMKDAGRSLAGDRSRGTLSALAAAEVAMAVVLLTAAGVMVDTFYRLNHKDLGFDPQGVLNLQAEMTGQRYATDAARVAFLDRLLERVRSVPGVERAALTTVNPLCCGDWGMRMTPEGHPPVADALVPIVAHQLITPGYFETMRIRIVDGRGFEPADTAGRELVAVVDERLARRFWPGERAVGKRVKRGNVGSPYPWLTIVGVVGSIDDEAEYAESWYLPYAQHATGPSSGDLHLMLRADNPLALAPAIRAASAEIDPAFALHDVSTMDRVHSDRLEQSRMGAALSSIFAVAGLLLAMLGLYGVLAFVLAADTREIGVRVALGARPSSVLALIVGRGLRLAGWGLLSGAIAAAVVGQLLTRVVPDARLDLRIVGAAMAALLLASLTAAAVPARRALRMDPLEALRAD
jgi:predicted permease